MYEVRVDRTEVRLYMNRFHSAKTHDEHGPKSKIFRGSETAQAIDSYRQALETLEEGVGNRQLLVIKLEALGTDAEQDTDLQAEADGGEV